MMQVALCALTYNTPDHGPCLSYPGIGYSELGGAYFSQNRQAFLGGGISWGDTQLTNGSR